MEENFKKLSERVWETPFILFLINLSVNHQDYSQWFQTLNGMGGCVPGPLLEFKRGGASSQKRGLGKLKQRTGGKRKQ